MHISLSGMFVWIIPNKSDFEGTGKCSRFSASIFIIQRIDDTFREIPPTLEH